MTKKSDKDKRREATEKALDGCETMAEIVAAVQSMKDAPDAEILRQAMDAIIGRE